MRGQFLDVIQYLIGVRLSAELWDLELARVPEKFGDFLAFRVVAEGEGEATADLFKAKREPGVNSGNNPLITSIRKTRIH